MKITKKTIATELKSLDITRTYRIAKICGVNVKNKMDIYNWIKSNAPTEKVKNKAYEIAFESDRKKMVKNGLFKPSKPQNMVLKTISHAKIEMAEKRGRYSKILIFGNNNIYWASPIYQHADYNKSIAMPRTQKNEKLANLINGILIK
jgi:hypothetical protein